jgi:hypothetical protein
MTAEDFMEEFKNLFPKCINNFRIKPTIKYEMPNWSDGNKMDNRYMIFKCVIAAIHWNNDKLRQTFAFELGMDALHFEKDEDFKAYEMDYLRRQILELIGKVIVWCNENEPQEDKNGGLIF